MSDAATPLDIVEQGARIRRMRADVRRKVMDRLKRHHAIRLAPSQIIVTSAGATAALFGAAIALVKRGEA